MAFTFHSQEDINNWKVNTDKRLKMGKSHATFELGPHKTGIFRGFLDSTPKHGDFRTTAGFCNIMSNVRLVRIFCTDIL